MEKCVKYGTKEMTYKQRNYIERLLRYRAVDDAYRKQVNETLGKFVTRAEASTIIDKLRHAIGLAREQEETCHSTEDPDDSTKCEHIDGSENSTIPVAHVNSDKQGN